MKPVSMEEYNYWRPVYGTKPITYDRCELVTKQSNAKWIAKPTMSTSRNTSIRDIGSCISTRKRRFQLDEQDSMIEDLKQAEGLLEEAPPTRSERYKLIQDISISATKTDGVMNVIKKLNSQIIAIKISKRNQATNGTSGG